MIDINEKEFYELTDYVNRNYGIKLTEKRALIVGRLQNLLMEKGFRSFSEYMQYILSDPTGEAVVVMMNKLTTNHTFFMREVEHFNFFRDKVLPPLAAGIKSRDLRIWSAGCSSGEEPYTLAMILADYFGENKNGWDTRILATDISKNALDTAQRGIYTNEHIASLPPVWRSGYFKPLDREKSQVADRIRQDVIFRSFNLKNRGFPFKKPFHVIFCRNVMIYFDPETKRQLLKNFHDFLEPGGYLFIGHSESISREETPLSFVLPAVYRRQ